MRHAVARLICLALLLTASAAFADDLWLAETANAPLMTPPFRKNFYAGEFLRVKLVRGQALRLSLGPGSKGALVAVIPLKGGVRAGEKLLLRKEPLVYTETLEEAEELALKVFAGMANLEGDLETMTEHVLAEGESFTYSLPPFQESVVRFVNVSDFRSTLLYTFFSGGEDISKSSEWDRTITLEFKGSSLTKTWKSAADKLVVEAKKGTLLVKAGRPFAGAAAAK